jgi:ankyrin repeat protein
MDLSRILGKRAREASPEPILPETAPLNDLARIQDNICMIFSNLTALELLHADRVCKYFIPFSRIVRASLITQHLLSPISDRIKYAFLKTALELHLQSVVIFDFEKNGDKAICLAAKYGDLGMLKLLFSNGVHPYVNYDEPLRMTCRYGHMECFHFLISLHGVNPRANNDEPMKLACRVGAVEIVQTLLRVEGIEEILQQSELLIEVCKYNRENVLELLLRDPRVNPFNEPETPSILETAAETGNLRLVTLITEHRSFPGFKSTHVAFAASSAAKHGHLPVVKLLTKEIPTVPGNLSGALFNAALGFHYDELEHLLKVTSREKSHYRMFWSNLSRFLKNHDEEGLTIALFLEHNYEFSFEGFNPDKYTELEAHHQLREVRVQAREAARTGNVQKLEELIRAYGTVYFNYNEPLRIASRCGHVNVVKFFTSQPACKVALLNRSLYFRPTPMTSSVNNSPLIQSCLYGHDEVVGVLLGMSDIDNYLGNTDAMVAACSMGRVKIVKLLVEKYTKYKFNKYPEILRAGLKVAATKGHIEVVEALVNIPGIHSDAGESEVLYEACVNGHIEVVRLLLQNHDIYISVNNIFLYRIIPKDKTGSIIEQFLKHENVNPSNDHLVLAVQEDNFNAVIILLYHTEFKLDEFNIFIFAKSLRMLKMLLGHKKLFNPSMNDNVAIWHAIEQDLKEHVVLFFQDVRVYGSLTDNERNIIRNYLAIE